MPQAYGKAIQKLERQLPKSPSKRAEAVIGFFFFFLNWDSPHTRLNSHYEAWSYKKRSTKRITGYRKSV